ncbi:GNAT family N-acetyltransferase [Acinetobacter silvestris]|uniref:GNAT family N-acetyltransferase n=1 Tax=Acinetobacter silvestris TaxID=1977882 RepID=A0A1Y3CKI7_9GAMM|nr:GNAT family N-acetyltransferase [Acinetobacter silvestris]OTG67102.1 GNAT family N-acetyltransferase [Acinetobacter silvestris]
MKYIQANIKNTLSAQHDQLLNIWEKSIRATHDFLNEQQILQIKELIIKHHYFDHVQLFHVEHEQKIIGFIGLAYEKIEMLFIDPQYFHRGIEAIFIQHAVSLGINEVDVSEQNTKALAFYQKHGFHQIARSEMDAEGNPFPILHLRRKSEAMNDLDYHPTESIQYK